MTTVRDEPCRSCGGAGMHHETNATCPTCRGEGVTYWTQVYRERSP
jgi:DnaJ-class molecular chaperone